VYTFSRSGIIICLMAFAMILACAKGAYSSANETAKQLIGAAEGKYGHSWVTEIVTWLVDSTLHDTGKKLGMWEVGMNSGLNHEINSRLNLSAGLGLSVKIMDAPAAARMPKTLGALFLTLGADYKVNNDLSLDIVLAPGLNSDFKKTSNKDDDSSATANSEDIRTQAGFTGRYNASEKLTLLAGLIYQQAYKSTPVLPVIGAIYRPDELWTLTLAAPRPEVRFCPDKNSSYYVAGEISNEEYHLNDVSIGARIINYRDFKVLAGAEYILFSTLRVDITAGYAFERKFVFYDSMRNDVNIDSNAFVRLGISGRW